MSSPRFGMKAPYVIGAVVVVLALAGLLAFRLVGGFAPAEDRPLPGAAAAGAALPVAVPVPPAASVPAPRPIDLKALAVPPWGSSQAADWPVRFRTDLDLLAPLGTGTANAAEWFVAFTKRGGPRASEGAAAMKRAVVGPGDLGKVLPPGDPLLREAEPWCDQATMRFYPDLLPVQGWATPITNLLLTVTFARSWVARGMAATDPDKAMDDFRRAMRLGRLVRQEDAVVLADLIGMACIRIAAQGMYDLALKRGDTNLALASAIVLGEYPAQRLMTARTITRTSLGPYVRKSVLGRVKLEVPDATLEKIVEVATSGPDRRFRGEAILQLNAVRFLGTRTQRDKALSVLNDLAAGKDPVIAASAVWARDTRPTRSLLEALGPLLN